jgi:hypothetical protein
MLNLYIAICDFLGFVIGALLLFGIIASICHFMYEYWNPLEWNWRLLWALFLIILITPSIVIFSFSIFGNGFGLVVASMLWSAAAMTVSKAYDWMESK